MGEMVTKAGFYDGKFRKAGQFHSGEQSDDIASEQSAPVPPSAELLLAREAVTDAEKAVRDAKSADGKKKAEADLAAARQSLLALEA